MNMSKVNVDALGTLQARGGRGEFNDWGILRIGGATIGVSVSIWRALDFSGHVCMSGRSVSITEKGRSFIIGQEFTDKAVQK